MRGESRGSEASDVGQDLVCGLGPAKGFGLLVVGSDEFADRRFEFLYAGVRTALDLPLCKQCEPAFHLVEPGGVRGSEVQVIS